MAWTFIQATGELLDPAGNLFATGYAGAGKGKDNPAMESVRNIGPLPEGRYNIGSPRQDPHMGAYVLPLEHLPGTPMFGRAGFYIHGDSAAHPGMASEGCIVLGIKARMAMWDSGDLALDVRTGIVNPLPSTAV